VIVGLAQLALHPANRASNTQMPAFTGDTPIRPARSLADLILAVEP
jgi:hypothetical protein